MIGNDTIAQALQQLKTEQGDKFSPDKVNLDYSVAPEAPVRNFEQQLSDKNSSALR